MKIEHPMPTSEQMREAVQRRIDLGLRLGASHNWRPHPGAQAEFIAGSTTGRWNYCNGFSRKGDKP